MFLRVYLKFCANIVIYFYDASNRSLIPQSDLEVIAMSALLNSNPLYPLFQGLYNVALTTTALLFLAAIVAFARRNPRTGFGLLAGTAVAGFGTWDLTGPHQHRTWVTSIASLLALMALITLVFVVAWMQRYSVSRKAVTINALLLMAAVAVAMGSESVAYRGYGSEKDWFRVADSAWFAILVLACSLVLVSLAYAVINRNNSTFYRKLTAKATDRRRYQPISSDNGNGFAAYVANPANAH
jgi:hypothetical protein